MSIVRQVHDIMRAPGVHPIAAWWQACAAIEAATDAEVARSLVQLDVELAVVEAQHRIALPDWATRLISRGEPRVQLCRVLGLRWEGDVPWRAIESPDARPIERVMLSSPLVPGDIPRLARHAARSRWRALSVRGPTLEHAVAPLLQLSLEDLKLEDCGLNGGVLARVGAVRVRGLDLELNLLSTEDVELLVALPGIDGVERLGLATTRVNALAVDVLARGAMRALTALDLRGTQVSDGGAETLASSAAFANLTSVHLTSAGVGDDGASALAANTVLDRLVELDLGMNQIGATGAARLIGSTRFPALRRLDLTLNPIADDLLDVLGGVGLRGTSIAMDDGSLTAEACDALEARPELSALLSLARST